MPLGVALSLMMALLQLSTTGVAFPLWWVGPLFSVSVAVHEWGHAAVLGCLRMPVESVRIHWGRVAIEVGDSPPSHRLAAAVVGPLAATLSGVLAVVLWGDATAAAVYLVFGLAHGLTLVLPGGDTRAALDALQEIWVGRGASPGDRTNGFPG